MMNHEKIAEAVGESVGKQMDAVRKTLLHFADAMVQLEGRLKSLEERKPERGEAGERGADGTNGKDGSSVAVDDVAPLIADLVAKAVAEIPPPKDGVDGKDGANGADGRSIDMAEAAEAIGKMIAETFAAMPTPKDGADGANGKDADPIDVKEVVAELLTGDEIKTLVDLHVAEALPATVAKHFEANPVQHGKDGRDGKDGEPGPRGSDGAKGDPGRDGLDVKDLFRADGGRLVAVLSDGTTKELGEFVGKDGKDGLNGKDGADFTECEIDYDGERTITIRSGAATITKTVPIPLDRGYYREGMASEKGDIVTHDGNAWIAQRDTKAKPCRESGDWRMLARRGRDGRDGIDAKPAPGPVKLNGQQQDS